jgi:predicted kinase
VSRLILLNGPPACGKSTVARRYADDHPLALNLDVDLVRDLIGRWRDEPHAAGLLAREIALAAARTHLDAGHDVVVPQFLARPAFIEQLADLAGNLGVAFHEIVLLDSPRNVLLRFADRGPTSEHAATDPEELAAMYDRFMAMLRDRPRAQVVHVAPGDVDGTYRAVLDRVSDRAPSAAPSSTSTSGP